MSRRLRRAGSSGFSRRASGPAGPGAAAAVLLALTAPLWVVLLRHAVAELTAIGGVAPDVALAAVAAAAWVRPSAFSAVLFGLAVAGLGDLASDVPWGLAAARVGAVAAVFAGAARVLDGPPIPGGSVVVVGLFAALERLTAALTLGAWVPEADLSALATRGLAVAAYTALLGPLAFVVARRLTPAPADPRRRRR